MPSDLEIIKATREVFERTLILGNSGSGNNWLAVKVAEAFGAKAIDLDGVHWKPGDCSVAREKPVAIGIVQQEALRATWVIEGVFGWLAQEAVLHATALVWLDILISECLDNMTKFFAKHLAKGR